MTWWQRIDLALGIIGAGIFIGIGWVLWGPQFAGQIDRLRIGRRRLAGLAVLCSLGSTLWIGSPGWLAALPVLPDADLSWRLVGYGLLVPWSTGLTTLAFMEWRIARDDVRVARQQPRPERTEVLEGEVVR